MRQFRLKRTYSPSVETYRFEGQGFCTSWHLHREYQIVAMEQGVRRFRIGDTCCEFASGDIAIIPPFTLHSGLGDEAESRFLLFYLEAEIINGPLRSAPSRGARARLPLRLRDEELFEALTTHGTDPERLTDLFGQAAARHRIGLHTHEYVHSHVRRARRFIELYYRASLSLDEIAKEAGCSKYHLSRQFSQAYGLAPHAYQLQLRIMAAKARLNEGFSVTETALLEGFCDTSHLNRHFRAVTGLSPRDYLRRKN